MPARSAHLGGQGPQPVCGRVGVYVHLREVRTGRPRGAVAARLHSSRDVITCCALSTLQVAAKLFLRQGWSLVPLAQGGRHWPRAHRRWADEKNHITSATGRRGAPGRCHVPCAPGRRHTAWRECVSAAPLRPRGAAARRECACVAGRVPAAAGPSRARTGQEALLFTAAAPRTRRRPRAPDGPRACLPAGPRHPGSCPPTAANRPPPPPAPLPASRLSRRTPTHPHLPSYHTSRACPLSLLTPSPRATPGRLRDHACHFVQLTPGAISAQLHAPLERLPVPCPALPSRAWFRIAHPCFRARPALALFD